MTARNTLSARGYALTVVLIFLVVFSILTVGLSENMIISQKHALAAILEVKSEQAADSGIAFALESIRQSSNSQTPWWNAVSQTNAVWNLLETENGTSVCFKAFPQGAPNPQNRLAVLSYGEAVQGTCGDDSGNPKALLSARTVSAAVDLTSGQEQLIGWREVLP